MSRNRVGDAMIVALIEEGTRSVCTLDGTMADVGRNLDLPLWRGMAPHPINYAQVASSYLARDDRFEVALIRAHDTIGRERRLRLFTLKETS